MEKPLSLVILAILAWSNETLSQEALTERYFPSHEFQFSRLMYSGGNCLGLGYGWGSDECVDWPHAEHYFMQGLTRLTSVNGALVSSHDGNGGR